MIKCERTKDGNFSVEIFGSGGPEGEDLLARELQVVLKGIKDTFLEMEYFEDENAVNAVLMHMCATALYSGEKIRMKGAIKVQEMDDDNNK